MIFIFFVLMYLTPANVGVNAFVLANYAKNHSYIIKNKKMKLCFHLLIK